MPDIRLYPVPTGYLGGSSSWRSKKPDNETW